MAELPRFQRSTGIPGGIGGDRASPAQTGAGAFARTLEQAGGGLLDVGEALDRIQQTKEAAWISRATGEAEIYTDELETRLEQESQEGAPQHVEAFKKDWGAYRNKVLSAAPSKRARRALEARLNSVETYGVRRAGRFKANAELTKRAADFDVALNGHVFAVQRDPSRLPEVLNRIEGDFSAASQWMPADDLTRAKVGVRERVGVAVVSGMIERNPSQAISALQSGELDSLLTPEKASSLMRSAQAEQRSRAAAARAAAAHRMRQFLTGFDDYAAFIASGGVPPPDAPYTPESIVANLGAERAGPVLEALKDAELDGTISQAVRLAAPENLAGLRAQLAEAAEGFEDFRDDSARLERFDRMVAERNKAIVADPVGFVLQTNPAVAEVAAEVDGSTESTQRMAEAALVEQERLGVPPRLQKVLPARQAKEIVAEIVAAPSEEQAGRIAAIQQQYGQFADRAMLELREAGLPGALGVAALYTDDPALSQELVAAAANAPEIEKTLPSEVKRQIGEEVAAGLEPFRVAFQAGDFTGSSTETYVQFQQSVEALAKLRATTGRGDAQSAIEDMVDSRYHVGLVGGTVYAPRFIGSTPVDPAAIEEAARAMQFRERVEAFKPLPFATIGGPEFLDRERTIRAAVHSGTWVTSPDGLGATLMVPVGGAMLPLVNEARELYEFRFEDAGGIVPPLDIQAIP